MEINNSIKHSSIKPYGSPISSNPPKNTQNDIPPPCQCTNNPGMHIENCVHNVKEITKLMVVNPDYSYIAPVVEEPKSWKGLTLEEKEKKTQECLNSYYTARNAMERSVAIVASSDINALAATSKLAERMWSVLEADVYTEWIEKHGEKPSEDQLTLAINEKLTKLFGEEGYEWTGSVGLSPLAIRNIFKKGNLREVMYVALKYTYWYSKDLFANEEKVKKINEYLESKGLNWKLNTEQIKYLKEQSIDNQYDGIYQHSPITGLSRTDVLRHLASDPKKIAKKLVGTISDEITKLSPGEIMGQTGEVEKYTSGKEHLRWIPGGAHIVPKTVEEITPNKKTYTYLKSVKVLGAPQTGSISGTTDTNLTLALFLSMQKDLQDLRLATLGFMLSEHHHSYIEVMTASKAFGVEFIPGPDDYKYIRPNDTGLLKKLEIEQNKQGYSLPESYLHPDK